MKNSLLVLFILVTSCKKSSETYSMYGLLNDEFTYSSRLLKEQISENLSQESLASDSSAILYHNLTDEYLVYLDNTATELLKKIDNSPDHNEELLNNELINKFFFNGEHYNEKATEFISKMETYRTEILKLIENQNLAKRVITELDTDYILNREGKKLEYLNFLYKDAPLISVLSHMGYREKIIIEFENDFLKNRILSYKTSKSNK